MNGLLCPTCHRVHFTTRHLCWDGLAWKIRTLYPWTRRAPRFA